MKYYTVRKGHKMGIYYSKEDFKINIKNFENPEYKIFRTEKEAELYLMKPLRSKD